MSWWNPFSWVKKNKNLSRKNEINLFDNTEQLETTEILDRRGKTVTDTTVAPQGRVRVRNVQWKPSKKKFRHTLKHHKSVLRASNTIFSDYKDELGDNFEKLKKIISDIDNVYSINLVGLEKEVNRDHYVVRVRAGFNQMAVVIRTFSNMDKSVKQKLNLINNKVVECNKQKRKEKLRLKKLKRSDPNYTETKNKIRNLTQEHKDNKIIFTEIQSQYKKLKNYAQSLYNHFKGLKKTKAFKG